MASAARNQLPGLWQREPPSDPGYYWHKSIEGMVTIKEVFGIERSNGETTYYWQPGRFQCRFPVDTLHGKWIGPLQVPE